MKTNNTKLKRTLRFSDILVLAFSTMIGWGWVSLTGTWVVQGGTVGAISAFVLGAVLCIFVGLTYCELTTMLPYAGGELLFSYKALGYNASWFTGWMICFAYIGVAAWEGPALATAIDYIIPIPRLGYLYTIAGFDVYLSWLIIPAITGSLLIIINYRGINLSAIFQSIVTCILALGGVIFGIISAIKGDIHNISPLVTNSSGVFAVVLAVPAMFVGFDVIPQVAEEMNFPVKKIPKAIILSICMAAAWYIVMIFSAALSAPSEVLSGSEGLTVVNAINYSTKGILAGKLIVITAIMGILTSWNGFIIGATRVLFSMGREKMIPQKFGSLHKKFNTPYFSTLFVGIITIFSPLLGKNSLVWFVDASGFGTVIAYLMVAISFVVLRKKYPDYDRPLKVKRGVGIIAIIVSAFFIILYLPIGNSSLNGIEWLIVLVWLIIGLVFYINSSKKIIKQTIKKIVILCFPYLYQLNRYKKIYGKKPDLRNPCTFSEKIFKFIVNNRNKIYTICADKIKVREYLREKIEDVEKYFPKTYFITDNIESITYEQLPEEFVLKSNHASGHIIICKDKNNFDLESAKRTMNSWLNENFYYKFGERQYKNIHPKIICEELLSENITDYRIFCLQGEPFYIRVTKHDERARLGYAVGTYDLKWNKIDLLCESDTIEADFDKPIHLIEMTELSKKIAKDFDFVRVDLYDCENQIYIAELTFTPNGGMSKFINMEWDKKLGEMLPDEIK